VGWGPPKYSSGRHCELGIQGQCQDPFVGKSIQNSLTGCRESLYFGFMKYIYLRAASLVICLTVAQLVNASRVMGADALQTFSSPANGYSVSFPGGWKRLPDEDVEKMVAVVHKSPSAQNLRWEAIYQSGEASISLNYPYVILQVASYGGGQIDDAGIQSAVKAMTGNNFKSVTPHTGNEAMDAALSSASFGVAQYDAGNHVVYQPISMNIPAVGDVKGMIISHFGRNAVVSVMCYDRINDFAKTRPTFDQIAGSFQFDSTATFVPHYAFLQNVGAGAIRGALVGGLVGAIVGGIMWLKRRKTNATT
jgi:hypothetical protein